MKSTGVVRRIDRLGRLVIPMEIRKVFDLGKDQGLEIFVDGEYIIISKFYEKCVICSSIDGLTLFDCKLICCECVSRIGQIG